MDNKKLSNINTDIIFYLLLVIASSISLYLTNEKKKNILNNEHDENLNLHHLYKVNRTLVVIINLYFLITIYSAYEETKKSYHTEKEIEEATLALYGIIFFLIGSLINLSLSDNYFIIDE